MDAPSAPGRPVSKTKCNIGDAVGPVIVTDGFVP